jgi:hypothetical protein
MISAAKNGVSFSGNGFNSRAQGNRMKAESTVSSPFQGGGREGDGGNGRSAGIVPSAYPTPTPTLPVTGRELAVHAIAL